MFTQRDLDGLEQRGISLQQFENQIKKYAEGFPFMPLIKPATVNDGIERIDPDDRELFINIYEQHVPDLEIVKFVPASGAASRMFKDLFDYTGSIAVAEPANPDMLRNKGFGEAAKFIENLRSFAFFDQLAQSLRKSGTDLPEALERGEYNLIIKHFLSESGLGYADLPKGLLLFHNYPQGPRTAVEEHLFEGGLYCQGKGGVKLHFTVSPDHQEKFRLLAENKKGIYEEVYQSPYSISYSTQNPATDALAVTSDNAPFRDDDGSLLFRPAGHGALLDNLNAIEADLIFIKNIDNVVADHMKPDTVLHKKIIGGILLYYREKIFNYLTLLEEKQYNTDRMLLDEIGQFIQEELHILPSDQFEPKTKADTLADVVSKLNRPIRVCGMVKNTGEPGGGPFWAINPDRTASLQIVETTQIDRNNPVQEKILQASTHFNPVDLVCCIRDYKGNPFDLQKFVDSNAGFIAHKSKGGKNLKSMELPGLWNGSMSKWITLFVEVPIETFNPVKTVNDLLRPAHQPKIPAQQTDLKL